MFESVALSDEALNFWCKVGVVHFSIASRNVLFVCILYNFVELFDCFAQWQYRNQ